MSTHSARLLGTLAKEMNLAEPELIDTFHKKIPSQKQRSKTLLAFLHKYGEVPKSKLVVLQRTMRAALKVTSDAELEVKGGEKKTSKKPAKPAEKKPAEKKPAEKKSLKRDSKGQKKKRATDKTPALKKLADKKPEVKATPDSGDPEEGRDTPIATKSVEEVRAIAQVAKENTETVIPSISSGGTRRRAGLRRQTAGLKRKTAGGRALKRKTEGAKPKAKGAVETEGSVAPTRRSKAILIGAAFFFSIIIIAGVVTFLPDGRVHEAVGQARIAYQKKELQEAYTILSGFTDEELVGEGLKLRTGIQEDSTKIRRDIDVQVTRMVERRNLTMARECLDLGKGKMIDEDFQALEDKLGYRIQFALQIKQVGELSKSKDYEKALALFDSIPVENRPEGSKTLDIEIRNEQKREVLAALLQAKKLSFKGENGEAEVAKATSMGGKTYAEECAKVRRSLAGIRGESATAAKVAEHLKKKQPELALALISSGFRYSRELSAFKALHTKTLVKLKALVRSDEEEKGPEAAWSRLAAAGSIDSYPDLSDTREELLESLQEKERAQLAALVDAGKFDKASESLEAVARRPWTFSKEKLKKIRLYIRAATKGQVFAAERKRFDRQIADLRDAYKDHDFAAIDRCLQGRWKAPSVLAFIQIERRVRAEFEALLLQSMEGFETRKGQSITVKFRKGSTLTNKKLTAVSKAKRTLSFKIGGGNASYKLQNLDWDEVLRFAGYGSQGGRLPLRTAVALYARGDPSDDELEEQRSESLARAILALVANEENNNGLGPNPLTDPDAIPGIPEPAEEVPEEKPSETPKPATPKPGVPAGPDPTDPLTPGGGDDYAPAAESQQITAFISKGEIFKGEILATDLLKKYPKDPTLHGFMGRIHYRLGRFASCRESLKTASSLSSVWEDELRNKNALIEFLYANDEKVDAHLASIESMHPGVDALKELMRPRGLQKVESKKGNYLVYADPVLAAKGGHKYTANLLEKIYKVYSDVFPFPRDENVVSRCYIFSKTFKFKQFATKIGYSGDRAKGFFAPTQRILVIDADAGNVATNSAGFNEDNIRTVFHEAFHQFINIYVPDIPLWFNEGLADYFGRAVFHNKRLVLGKFPRFLPGGKRSRYDVINSAIRDPQEEGMEPLELETFLRQTDTEFRSSDEKRHYMNYCQGWSFIHFLLHSKNKKTAKIGKKLLKNYFKFFREGKGRDLAFEETFGKVNIQSLEAAWRRHVKVDM